MRDIDSIRSTSGQLSGFLRESMDLTRVWQNDELAAVLKHQLSAPVEVDLGSLEEQARERTKVICEQEGLLLKSFGDLVFHKHPPLELLVMTKDFAKRCAASKRGLLPQDVALVLYYASIASALINRNTNISKLSFEKIDNGLHWAQDLTWIGDDLMDLFSRARTRIAETQD